MADIDDERIAQRLGNLRKSAHLLRLRLLMHAVHGRKIHPLQVSGHAFVGRDHEVLDDAFGFAALAQDDILRHALFIHDDL